jgi:hypothetical protein
VNLWQILVLQKTHQLQRIQTMRVLITIPHYFNAKGDGRYGSTQPNPQPRLAALTQCLRSLLMLTGDRDEAWFRDGNQLQPGPANQTSRAGIDIVICTCGDQHLLEQLQAPPDATEHVRCDCDPMYLGFECHDVLRERLGSYDLYGYMEDDLILHDPAFFTKIVWFHGLADEEMVLQPNRYERYISPTQLKKVYIDFEFAPKVERVANRSTSIFVEVLGREIELRPTTNPHSGCFFLGRQQMTHWIAQDHFGQRDASFVGPLESAASLGLARTFRVFKPAPRNASFFEIEHYGQMWSRRLAAVRMGS